MPRLIKRTMRRAAIITVLAPLAGRIAETAATQMEQRGGPNRNSRRLRQAAVLLRGRQFRKYVR
jgi:hypothetical protein